MSEAKVERRSAVSEATAISPSEREATTLIGEAGLLLANVSTILSGLYASIIAVLVSILGFGSPQPDQEASLPEARAPWGFHELWVGHTLASGDYISPDQELDLARDAGADVVRIGLDWSEVEYERGHHDWSGIDERLERVYTRGLRPIIVIGSAPEWARQNNWEDDCHTAPQKLCSHPPAARHAMAFGEFAGDVFARYRAIAYEIWNEPNSPRFWAPRPDPDLYLKLLSEARQGLNKTGSTTPLIVGGLAPVGNEGSGIPASDFLHHLYTNQDSKLFDGVGYHPYPGTRGDWERQFLERMHEIRRVMTRHNDEAGTLWLTEIGVPSRSEDAPDGAPPEKQGAILYWLYRLSAEFNVAAFVIYRLFEDPSEGGRWQSFGVAEADLTPKPALDDVRRLFGASPGL